MTGWGRLHGSKTSAYSTNLPGWSSPTGLDGRRPQEPSPFASAVWTPFLATNGPWSYRRRPTVPAVPEQVAHLPGIGLAGLALLSGVQARLAATLTTFMMACFVVLLHLPRVIANPELRVEWIMLAVSSSLTGAAWLVRKYST